MTVFIAVWGNLKTTKVERIAYDYALCLKSLQFFVGYYYRHAVLGLMSSIVIYHFILKIYTLYASLILVL